MTHSIARVVLLGLFISGFTHADETDDVMGGFDDLGDTTVISSQPISESTDESNSGLTGSIALSASYNWVDHYSSNPSSPTNRTDWEGLSKLRTRLNLEYNTRIHEQWDVRVAGYAFYDSAYSLRDRDRYADNVLDDYESELDSQEVWVRGKLRDNLDMRIGRQIVNWGRADSIRVLDILNPLDNREPGLADIEDLRLPVTMIKTDYFIDPQWQTSFIVIPEVRFSKNSPTGHDFEIPGSDFKEEKPENFSDSSYAASIMGIFSGWDVSFHTARHWRDVPYLDPVFNPTPTPLAGSTLKHSRTTMFGAGANYTRGAWLYKAEVAYHDGYDYTTGSFQPGFGLMPTGTTEKNRVDGLLGIEYFGIANTVFSVEVGRLHIQDYKSNILSLDEDRDSTGLALRANRSMLNDRLDLNAVIFGNFGESGGGTRLDAEYDLRDALVLKTGIVMYKGGDMPVFDAYSPNDRVFAEIKYSF